MAALVVATAEVDTLWAALAMAARGVVGMAAAGAEAAGMDMGDGTDATVGTAAVVAGGA